MDFSLRHSHASSYLFILCHARLALFLPTDFSFDFIFAYKIYGLSGLRCLFVSYCFQLFIAISFVFIMLLHANGYFFSSFISFLLLIQFIPVLRIYLFLCGIRKKSTHHQQQKRMQSVFLSAVWFHSLYLKYQFRFNVEMWTERARETGRKDEKKIPSNQKYISLAMALHVLRFVIFQYRFFSTLRISNIHRSKKNVMHK